MSLALTLVLVGCGSAAEFDTASTWQPISEGPVTLGTYEVLVDFHASEKEGGILSLYDTENQLTQVAQALLVPPTQRVGLQVGALQQIQRPGASFLSAACGSNADAYASANNSMDNYIVYTDASHLAVCGGYVPPNPTPTPATPTPVPTPFDAKTQHFELANFSIGRAAGPTQVLGGYRSAGPCLVNNYLFHDFKNVTMTLYNFRDQGNTPLAGNYPNSIDAGGMFEGSFDTSLTVSYGEIPATAVSNAINYRCEGFDLVTDPVLTNIRFTLKVEGSAVLKNTADDCPRIASAYPVLWQDTGSGGWTYYGNGSGSSPPMGDITIFGCGFIPQVGDTDCNVSSSNPSTTCDPPVVLFCDSSKTQAELGLDTPPSPYSTWPTYEAWLAGPPAHDPSVDPLLNCYAMEINSDDYTDKMITAPVNKKVPFGGEATLYIKGTDGVDSGTAGDWLMGETIHQNQGAVFNITLGFDPSLAPWGADGGENDLLFLFGPAIAPTATNPTTPYNILMYACDGENSSCTVDEFGCPGTGFTNGDSEIIQNWIDTIGHNPTDPRTGVWTESWTAPQGYITLPYFSEIEYQYLGFSSLQTHFYIGLDLNRNQILDKDEPYGFVPRRLGPDLKIYPGGYAWGRMHIFPLDYQILAESCASTAGANRPPVASLVIRGTPYTGTAVSWHYEVPENEGYIFGSYAATDWNLNGWELVELDLSGSADPDGTVGEYKIYFPDLQEAELFNEFIDPAPQTTNPSADNYYDVEENSFTTTSDSILLYLPQIPNWVANHYGAVPGWYAFGLKVIDNEGVESQKITRGLSIWWNQSPYATGAPADQTLTADSTGGANVTIPLAGLGFTEPDPGDSISKYFVEAAFFEGESETFSHTWILREFAAPQTSLAVWLPSGEWKIRVGAEDTRGGVGYTCLAGGSTANWMDGCFTTITINPVAPSSNEAPILEIGWQMVSVDDTDGSGSEPISKTWFGHGTGYATDPDGTIAYYEWHDHLGNSLTGGRKPYSGSVTPTAAYPVTLPVGYWNMTLTVWDNSGYSTSAHRAISVKPLPTPTPTPIPLATPVAVPELLIPVTAWDTTTNPIQACVIVAGSASYDPDDADDEITSDAEITAFAWVSTSGGVVTQNKSGAAPKYCYTSSGTKTIALTVTDNEGANSTAVAINVSIPAPPAVPLPPTCIAQRTAGTWNKACTTYTATFSGATSYDNDESGASIASYVWSGSTSGTGVTKNQGYTTGGLKSVTLTCTDDEGESDVDTLQFIVPVCGPPPEEL